MSPKMTNETDYILVEPQEAEYWEIIKSFGRLVKTADYPDKNVIWDFRNCLLKTTYDQLYKIKNFVKQKYPDTAKPGRRVAIVAEGGLNSALVEEYIKIAEELPPEFNIFSDLDSAEDWVKKK